MSLRATGEGHISSIEFRAGLVSADGDLTFDPVSRSVLSEVRYPRCHKADFVATLLRMGIDESFIAAAFGDLRPASIPPTSRASCVIRSAGPPRLPGSTSSSRWEAVRWAAHGDYVIAFPSLARAIRAGDLSRLAKRAGRHRRRAVRALREDDGSQRYYATYTAFDRNHILPQLIETEDFLEFRPGRYTGRRLRTRAWRCSRAALAAATRCSAARAA